ncbi:peptidyl-prolyl cis-trans isomerase FKBP8-like [Scyliorhinus canicula]|uniref:peptidyl-prolyl cis-trans isomerase FKBP8-like n=1 Tax=Scyliorhinus canicula TaxID=7830 RepID=UPI0018F78D2F|nr:peptidyl-prolyl cis-trans isomerase FKBP8-like [Scyliorhinus canicula]
MCSDNPICFSGFPDSIKMTSAENFDNILGGSLKDAATNSQIEESFQEINTIVNKIEEEHIETVLYYCDQLLEMNPKDIMTLYSKGKVLFRKEYYSQAISVLKEALTLVQDSQMLQHDLDLAMKGLVDQQESQGDGKNKAPSNNTLQRKISISWKWLIGGVAVALGGAAATARLSKWK